MLKFYEWCAVAYTRLVTVLPNDTHDTNKMRITTGAYWPFLADVDFELQSILDIREYTDAHHRATVPHTLVLAPALVIDKIYVGYWFWGRPSVYDLWADLRDLGRRIHPDFDPTVPAARDSWLASQR
jgi:hypothetical protein